MHAIDGCACLNIIPLRSPFSVFRFRRIIGDVDMDRDGRVGGSIEGLADGRDVGLECVVGVIVDGNEEDIH